MMNDVSSVIMDFGAKTEESVVQGIVIYSVQKKKDTVEIAISDKFIIVHRI